MQSEQLIALGLPEGAQRAGEVALLLIDPRQSDHGQIRHGYGDWDAAASLFEAIGMRPGETLGRCLQGLHPFGAHQDYALRGSSFFQGNKRKIS